MKKLFRSRTILFFIILFIVSGCGIWRNFKTYFNLFYNTKQAYNSALEGIEEQRTSIFDLKEPKVTKDIDSELDEVIEKGSKVLQYHAESAYVDDALFMVGVAIYYKGQYAKAMRKFKELGIQTGDNYKLKTRLWLAKCDFQLRNFDEGLGMLQDLQEDAINADKKDILEEIYKTLTAYYIDRHNYNQAIKEANELLNVSGDDELKAQAAYEIGMLYIDQHQNEDAIAAFQRVLDYSPDFATEFKSKFEIAKLKKELGEKEESYKMLESLYNEGKYQEYWGDIYYEMGLMQFEAGDTRKAFDIFSKVESVYSGTEGAGRSELMLGEIMKNEYADYDSALTYYDKVEKSKATPDIKEEAKNHSNSIKSYVLMKKSIGQTKRKIEYLSDPQTFVIDSLAYERYLDNKRKEGKKGQIPNRQRDKNNNEEEENTAQTDSSSVTDSLKKSTSGEFAFDIDEDYIVTEKPIKPRVSLDSLNWEQQANYYRLGNLFLLDYEQPDSAYIYYSKIINEFDDVKNKPRVLFALGTYYEAVGQMDKADSLYNEIYDNYKTYKVANEAAGKLGKPPLVFEEDPAEELYLQAEKEIDSLNTDSAFVILDEIAEKYPESVYTPKSIYTKGWLYENVIDNPDSALSMYTELVNKYENSLYASNVQGKVEAYNQMLVRQKAVEDSIAAANAAVPTEQVQEPDSSGTEIHQDEILPEGVQDSSKTTESKIDSADVLKTVPAIDSLKTSENSEKTDDTKKPEEQKSTEEVKEQPAKVKKDKTNTTAESSNSTKEQPKQEQ